MLAVVAAVLFSLSAADGACKAPSLLQHSRSAQAPGWKDVKVFVGSAPGPGKKGETYSQANQDWHVSTLLSCKRQGYFVDLAANDAEKLSNSLMLERDFNWTGLCIEPNLEYYYDLSKRKCTLVAAAIGSPTDSKVTFNMEDVLGGIVGFDQKAEKNTSRELRTVSLGELLATFKAPATIDYLSLDVEGAESLVMDSFPWNSYKFLVLSVERPQADLRSLLIQNGYTYMNISTFFDDEIWIHQSLPGYEDMKAQWMNHSADADVDDSKSCMHAAGYTYTWHPPPPRRLGE